MSQNKRFFILTFAIIAVLAVIAAGLYLSGQSKTNEATAAHAHSKPSRPRQSADLEQLKTHEFLDGEMTGDWELQPQPETAESKRPLIPGQTNSLKTGHNPLTFGPQTHQPDIHTPDLYTQAAKQAANLSSSQKPSRKNSLFTSANSAPNHRGNFAPMDQPTTQRTANDPFSPYMAALNKEQAANLEKQLNGLTDRVQATILRSLLPKSKKDMNIEKYLSHHKTSAAEDATSSGPFAEVARQISRQKNGLVQSMQEAFGDKAAGQAASIMDAYQQEIMNTLNKPGLTPEQIQQKTRQISQKYNQKLQKLSEKSGLERLETDLEKRDNNLLTQYQKSYNGQVCDGMSNIMEKYRSQEMELAKQGLPYEEYLEKTLALQRERDQKMRNYLIDNGVSPDGYLKATAPEKEEDPNKLPTAFRATQEIQEKYQEDAKARTDDLLNRAEPLYGKEGAALLKGPIENYKQEIERIWADPETSLEEKNELQNVQIEKLNNAIRTIQQTPQMKTLRENRQVEETLTQILQDPAITQAPAEQRAAFEKKARTVLHSMFERINAVADDPNLTDAQKQQQIQTIQQEAQQQLARQ